MTRTVTFIWFWSLVILPFTAIVTFVVTLIVCTLVPNHAPGHIKFPQISQLGTGEAHLYFILGFTILSPQLLIILIGRYQFLFQTQNIINRLILTIIHLIALVSCAFMLLMAIVSLDDDLNTHLLGAFGMFGTISLYCFLHAILSIYLFVNHSDAPQYSNILCPVWFTLCSLLLILFFGLWLITMGGIVEYIAAASPFLYLLGFVPQFWMRLKAKKSNFVTSAMYRYSSEISF